MTEEELQLAAFEIILHSGNARTSVHEAFAAMKEGKYDEAKEKLDAADAELLEAHHAQTDLLQKYTSGTEVKIEIIMVHAQDHLMTTMTLKEVAVEMITLYQRLDEKLREAFMLAFLLTMFESIVVVICILPFLSNDLKSLYTTLWVVVKVPQCLSRQCLLPLVLVITYQNLMTLEESSVGLSHLQVSLS